MDVRKGGRAGRGGGKDIKNDIDIKIFPDSIKLAVYMSILFPSFENCCSNK
jgi:hypothetical protein